MKKTNKYKTLKKHHGKIQIVSTSTVQNVDNICVHRKKNVYQKCMLYFYLFLVKTFTFQVIYTYTYINNAEHLSHYQSNIASLNMPFILLLTFCSILLSLFLTLDDREQTI